MHCLAVSHSRISDTPVSLVVFPWPCIPVSLTHLTICYVPVSIYKTLDSCMSHYVRISTLIHSVYLTPARHCDSTHNSVRDFMISIHPSDFHFRKFCTLFTLTLRSCLYFAMLLP